MTHRYMQVLYVTLKDLLDPTQHLYTKYCVLKVCIMLIWRSPSLLSNLYATPSSVRLRLLLLLT